MERYGRNCRGALASAVILFFVSFVSTPLRASSCPIIEGAVYSCELFGRPTLYVHLSLVPKVRSRGVENHATVVFFDPTTCSEVVEEFWTSPLGAWDEVDDVFVRGYCHPTNGFGRDIRYKDMFLTRPLHRLRISFLDDGRLLRVGNSHAGTLYCEHIGERVGTFSTSFCF